MSVINHILCFITIIACLLSATDRAYAQQTTPVSNSPEVKSHWTLLAGYGVTHKGMGETRAHVETADFILRYGRFLTDEVGRSWYRSRHEIMIEAPLHLVVDPDVSPMVGVNFLACWAFTASKQVIPYFFAGGGLLYTEAKIPGLGSNLNGNYQSGTGIRYKTENGLQFNIEYRLHHISNAGTNDPNAPLNSSKILLGVILF